MSFYIERFKNKISVLSYAIIFILLTERTHSKDYKKCDLLMELTLIHKVTVREAVKWTCLAGGVSGYRTNYTEENSQGIFGVDCNDLIGACGVTCDKFLDDDILDDLDCAKDQIEYFGDFEFYPKYNESECPGQLKNILIDCFGTEDAEDMLADKRILPTITKVDSKNCSTNSCNVMTSPSGQPLTIMLRTIFSNIHLIKDDFCESVHALNKVHHFSHKEIGMWACIIMDVITCTQKEGETECKINCLELPKIYDVITKDSNKCVEIVEVINESLDILNTDVFNNISIPDDCPKNMPDLIMNQCYMHISNGLLLNSHENKTSKKSILSETVSLLDKELHGNLIEDYNMIEVISNERHDPSTYDPCNFIVTKFSSNLTLYQRTAWLCFSHEIINCYRTNKENCFNKTCETLDDEDLSNDPDCDEYIENVVEFVKKNSEIILDTPKRPVPPMCKIEAQRFVEECIYFSIKQASLIDSEVSPLDSNKNNEEESVEEESDYQREIDIDAILREVNSYDETTETNIEDTTLITVEITTIPNENITTISPMKMIFGTTSETLVDETFRNFLERSCGLSRVFFKNPNLSMDQVASWFCFAYDLSWCSSHNATDHCNINCESEKQNRTVIDQQCEERLKQIEKVSDKLKSVLGTLSGTHYVPYCSQSVKAFIKTCLLEENSKRKKNNNVKEHNHPIYTRFPQSNDEISLITTTESLAITFMNSDAVSQEITTEIPTTVLPETKISQRSPVISQYYEPPYEDNSTDTTNGQMDILKTVMNINGCDLVQNFSLSVTEFTKTFCKIYDHTWCQILNDNSSCSVMCSSFGMSDTSEFCTNTKQIVDATAKMWATIFKQQGLTFIPSCNIWSKLVMEECPIPNESIQINDTFNTTNIQPKIVAKSDFENLETTEFELEITIKDPFCSALRSMRDLKLKNEEERKEWYCFTINIFKCSLVEKNHQDCPIDCIRTTQSLIHKSRACRRRYDLIMAKTNVIKDISTPDEETISNLNCDDVQNILNYCDGKILNHIETKPSLPASLNLTFQESIPLEKIDILTSINSNQTIHKKAPIEEGEIFPASKVSINETVEKSLPSVDTNICNYYQLFSNKPEVNYNIAAAYLCSIYEYLNCLSTTKTDCFINCLMVDDELLKGSQTCGRMLRITEKTRERYLSAFEGLDPQQCTDSVVKILANCTITDGLQIKEDLINSEIFDYTTQDSLTTTSTNKPIEVSIVDIATNINNDSTCVYYKFLPKMTELDSNVIASYICPIYNYIQCLTSKRTDCFISCLAIDDELLKGSKTCGRILRAAEKDTKLFLETFKLSSSNEDCKKNVKGLIKMCDVSLDDKSLEYNVERTIKKIETNEFTTEKSTTESSIDITLLTSTSVRSTADHYLVCDLQQRFRNLIDDSLENIVSYSCFFLEYLVCKALNPNCILNCDTVDDELIKDSATCHKLLPSIDKELPYFSEVAKNLTEISEQCRNVMLLIIVECERAQEESEMYGTETPIHSLAGDQSQPPILHTILHTLEEGAKYFSALMGSNPTPPHEETPLPSDEFHETTTEIISEISQEKPNACKIIISLQEKLELGSDPYEIVSYFCFIQDYLVCSLKSQKCNLNCDTTQDRSIKGSKKCKKVFGFINSIKSSFSQLVDENSDTKTCREDLTVMITYCIVPDLVKEETIFPRTSVQLLTTIAETPTTYYPTRNINDEKEDITTIKPATQRKMIPTVTNNHPFIRTQVESTDPSKFNDFLTVILSHSRTMAKAQFKIGLNKAELKDFVITPNDETGRFDVTFRLGSSETKYNRKGNELNDVINEQELLDTESSTKSK